MKLLRCLKYEFKSMVMQSEFLFAFILCCLLSLLTLGIPSRHYIPEYSITAPSPEQCSFLYNNPYGKLLYQYICPILASIPVACSYFKEKKNGMDALLIPTCGRANYILAKVLMTFLTGFFISILPFIIGMLYAEFAYPRNELVAFLSPMIYEGLFAYHPNENIFGQHMLTHPALDHFLHISLVGLWSAGAALLTLGISFFFRKHYIINLLLGTLILLFAVMLLNALELYPFNPQEYFQYKSVQLALEYTPNSSHFPDIRVVELSARALITSYSVLYGACAAFIAAHLIKHRDII